MTATLRIGTRGSALALAQAALVARALEAADVTVETVVIETAGDRRAPDTAWGEGAFVTAIETALVDGRVDVAVHSAKDVPTAEDPRLLICAFLPREEPRDVLVLPRGRPGTLATLASGTVVGTDSPRRTGFVRALRPDLDVRPLHGNVDTRLRRLDDGDVGALVLAAAGLIRLGREDRITELLAADVLPPAPGQGAIAVQIRADDVSATDLVGRIDHAATRAAVETERAFLSATGGGCRSPVGALATTSAGSIELLGGSATIDGQLVRVHRVRGTTDERLQLAQQLAALVGGDPSSGAASRVLVTRALEDSVELSSALTKLGLTPVAVPAIGIELLDEDVRLHAAVLNMDAYDTVVVTSANAVRAVARAADRLGVDLAAVHWAAVGEATARELRALGGSHVWLPTSSNAATLAHELPVSRGHRVLRLRGEMADESLATLLRERGARVDEVDAYRTEVAPGSSRDLLDRALEDGLEAVILASPSAVRGLLALADDARQAALMQLPAIVVGPVTAAAAREAGFTVVAEAATPSAAVLADLAAEHLGAPAVTPVPVGVIS